MEEKTITKKKRGDEKKIKVIHVYEGGKSLQQVMEELIKNRIRNRI